MKVHPAPKKRSITTTTTTTTTTSSTPNPKKLRRLPHVFSKVLELPFQSDTNVSVQETSDSFCFTATTTEVITDDVRAHTIELLPGVTKIVIKGTDGVDLWVHEHELELDVWRYRLPASTRPEMASARCSDGELIVTVPKEENLIDIDDDSDHDGDHHDEIFGVKRMGGLLL